MTYSLHSNWRLPRIPQAFGWTVRVSWILIGLWLLMVSSHTASLPFLESRFPFQLQAPDHPNLADKLNEALKVQRKNSSEFDLISQARKALRWDKDMLQKLLRAEGYFAAQIKSSLSEDDVLLHIVQPGPRYLIQTLSIDFPDNVSRPKKLLISEGDALQATKVLKAKKALEKHIEDNFCLFEIKLNYKAEVNHETASALLSYSLAPSPSMTFSDPIFQGNTRIKTSFLSYFITYQAGDCFKRKLIETTRLGLLQSNLITRVDTSIEASQNNEVKVIFEMTERAHRTWALGLGWESDTGLAFTPGWEHRNLFQEGEKLEIDALLSEDKQNVTSTLSFPHQWRKDQTLTLSVELQEETSQAFKETSGVLGAKITRPMWRRWLGSIGSNLEFNRTFKDEIEQDVALLSVPLTLDYIRTNNPLDPTRGWALGTRIEPFVDLYDTGTRFNKTSLAASWYITGKDWWAKPTLAIRAAFGSIADIDLERVPPDHRFYVGGGSSVRGYAYQLLGELNEEGDPTGGLSFGETAVEVRFRFSQNWGAAIFADGGYAYPGERPNFGDDFLWGAGVGIRYFTSFAPIRFDIAVPLDKRVSEDNSEVDDSVQIYISLGQAF